MGTTKEERDILCNRITGRVKAVLAWKELTVDEVRTEFGWDSARMKRLMQGKIRYKLEDLLILGDTFELPFDYFTADYGEGDVEVDKMSLMIMFSELSDEHKRDIIKMMEADDIEKASKELIEKLQAEQ